MDPDIDFNNMQIAEDFDTMIGKDSLTSTFSVFMPASTSVSATDGTYEGSTLKWTAKGNNETEIAVHVISENKNTGMYAIVIIGIIIVIVIIGLFVSRYIKKITDRRNSTDLEDNDPDTYDVDDDEDDEFEED